jgi:hypothetical protein
LTLFVMLCALLCTPPLMRAAVPPVLPADGGADVLSCRLCLKKPVIDGILDDECWRSAERAVHFHRLFRMGPASQHTECMVTYDAENLYIAFVCYETVPGGIRKRQSVRDGVVWSDDCVEVFLAPSPRSGFYFHLITNARGTRFDERVGPLSRPPNPASWDGEWTVGTASFGSGWTVEIAVTFRSLGVSPPPPGTSWGFNASRQEWRLGEQSSWSETFRWFHEPQNFGRLFFTPAF